MQITDRSVSCCITAMQALDNLQCKRRVLLSGTPMQNHLDEVSPTFCRLLLPELADCDEMVQVKLLTLLDQNGTKEMSNGVLGCSSMPW